MIRSVISFITGDVTLNEHGLMPPVYRDAWAKFKYEQPQAKAWEVVIHDAGRFPVPPAVRFYKPSNIGE